MSFLSRIWSKTRRKLIQLLEEKPKEIQQPVGEATPISNKPGLVCPECQFKMIISIEMLLSGEPIECPSCQLRLSVDKEESKPVLDRLRKLDEVVKEANNAKTSQPSKGRHV